MEARTSEALYGLMTAYEALSGLILGLQGYYKVFLRHCLRGSDTLSEGSSTDAHVSPDAELVTHCRAFWSSTPFSVLRVW